jgi:1-hydroxycarotenoid 3,4-desaturase
VIFNGDPRALATGLLGPDVAKVARQTQTTERSLSADVWSFAARPTGPRAPELAHHNVFFCADPRQEFDDLTAGRTPRDATLYICAQDRGTHRATTGKERFEIIRNAPPRPGKTQETTDQCQTMTFTPLRDMGLGFDRIPDRQSLSRPQDFDRLFPASQGSLYGQSPHGMTAALKRPRARTAIKGLFLVGGGAHPGAGVPMATLSARHVAEAIETDRTSTLPSRQTAMHGGTSTA